ncbi:c-type cytochrome [Billgrantia montanilacus]|uniref:Cytochrome c4 n=1 Tax=Billgrantia montanilacus TaxID=2282305 RepID=A0A368U3P3_9GAMM|nr:c-type cytochrome [Halomonas montanilacus]RCV91779.1 cytochrome c4 [Halomonas montanilacus]
MNSLSIATSLGLLLGLTAWPALAQEADPERGKAAAAVCGTCHQPDGSGRHVADGESWPRLSGLNAGYIANQLHDYKEGRRRNASMQPFANMLDDQQIVDVAAYYAKLPVTDGQGGDEADEAQLARGEQLALRGDWNAYIVSCKSCHGPGNEGVGSTFPGIAGQHAGYIEKQLLAWQAGERDNDAQNLMGAIAKRMNDEDIRAVAVWLSRQPVASE